MTKIIQVFAIIAFLLVSCKSTKGIKDSGDAKKISTAAIISGHDTNKSSFKTLKASLKVNYKTAEEEEAFTADLRMNKDKTIWISIKKFGIPGAKALITPDQVSYYNKIDKTFFEGDYSLISDLLGTDLTFKQLQAVLLGEAMFDMNPTTYDAELLDKAYLLRPEQQAKLFEHFITLNPNNFKVKSQEIAQPETYRILNIDYFDYQEVGKQLFPLSVDINIIEKTSETQINIEYRNVSLNQELRYPFKIPGHYKALAIE